MTLRGLEMARPFSFRAQEWQTQLEKRFDGVHRVEQNDWQTPTCADWVLRLHDKVMASQRPVVLVGHSLACSLIAQWAQQHSEAAQRVRGALLVAPSDTEADSYPQGTTGFTPMLMNPLPFNAITVASTDDPYVSVTRASAFSEAWGSELVWVHKAGHSNDQGGYGAWSEGVDLLFKLTGDPQFQHG